MSKTPLYAVFRSSPREVSLTIMISMPYSCKSSASLFATVVLPLQGWPHMRRRGIGLILCSNLPLNSNAWGRMPLTGSSVCMTGTMNSIGKPLSVKMFKSPLLQPAVGTVVVLCGDKRRGHIILYTLFRQHPEGPLANSCILVHRPQIQKQRLSRDVPAYNMHKFLCPMHVAVPRDLAAPDGQLPSTTAAIWFMNSPTQHTRMLDHTN